MTPQQTQEVKEKIRVFNDPSLAYLKAKLRDEPIPCNVCKYCGREFNIILSTGLCDGCLNYENHNQ
jgi:hypothetical protein